MTLLVVREAAEQLWVTNQEYECRFRNEGTIFNVKGLTKRLLVRTMVERRLGKGKSKRLGWKLEAVR
jgi:hypothetical protein